MKKNKERKIFIILLIILIFLFLIIGVTVGVVGAIEKNNKENSNEQNQEESKEMTIACVKEDGNDDVKKTEEVYLEDGIIIKRTDTSEWDKTDPKQETCDYYTLQTTKLNQLDGVSSEVTCNELKGKAVTIYTISEVNKDEIKLKQFDYITENYTFSGSGWMTHMKKNGYECSVNQ